MSEQKSSKRPALPLVLTANDLLSGAVVYFTRAGWSEVRSLAFVAEDEAAAEALETALRDANEEGLVVDAYLTPAGQGHYRERIRLSGPTIAYGAEAGHVSL